MDGLQPGVWQHLDLGHGAAGDYFFCLKLSFFIYFLLPFYSVNIFVIYLCHETFIPISLAYFNFLVMISDGWIHLIICLQKVSFF